MDYGCLCYLFYAANSVKLYITLKWIKEVFSHVILTQPDQTHSHPFI